MHGANDSPKEQRADSESHRHGEDGASKHHWIQGAVKHPGSFTAAAKKHHMGVHAYAEKEKGASGTLGRRARLALTFEKMAK